MLFIRRALCLSLGLIASLQLHADEPLEQAKEPQQPGPQPLLQTLPEDGAWVTYYVLMKIDGDENQVEWTAASVGTKDVDGEPHRWLELRAKGGDTVYRMYKALIPESKFAPGKNPMKDAREIWVRDGNDAPRRISSIREDDPYLDLLLSGPVSNVIKLDKTENVEWQKGRLNCEIWEGENKIEIRSLKVENTHRVLKNKSVPFGIAGAKVRLQGGNRSAAVELVLDSFGKDAKTLLPDIK